MLLLPSLSLYIIENFYAALDELEDNVPIRESVTELDLELKRFTSSGRATPRTASGKMVMTGARFEDDLRLISRSTRTLCRSSSSTPSLPGLTS